MKQAALMTGKNQAALVKAFHEATGLTQEHFAAQSRLTGAAITDGKTRPRFHKLLHYANMPEELYTAISRPKGVVKKLYNRFSMQPRR